MALFDDILGPPPVVPDANDLPDEDTIATSSSAPRTRNIEELAARIKQAGGALVVNANDSDYIVAINNGLRYSVVRLANGQYRVTESSNYLLLIVAAVGIGILVLSRR